MQLTPKSRSDIKQYGDIESEVNGLIGKINGRFGDAAWTPIRYVNRSYSRTVLAGMYRAAHVAMVTLLRDGMNLVAKEYLAAQDPEDPGVLVLSQFAGAAKELDRALIINPHETDAVAAALKARWRCRWKTARATRADACAPPQARHRAMGKILHVHAGRREDGARLARRHPHAV